MIAHHLSESGLAKRAVPYWAEAVTTATARWANTEAISYYKKALSAHREANSKNT